MPRAKRRAFLVTNHAPLQLVSGYAHITAEDQLIAVDNGLQRIYELGLIPHLIIGDFDSLDPALLSLYPDIPCIKHPGEKNETDTELALQWCMEQDCYDEIVICNDLEGRFDHAMAIVQNLLMLVRHRTNAGMAFRIESQTQILFCLPDHLELDNRKGQTISLIPLSAELCLLHSSGLKYPLQGLKLLQHQSRGISNEIISQHAEIEKNSGDALVVISTNT